MNAQPAPLVTVFMPVYNAMPYLAETVDSILAQTFQNFELVAIDDGSTDGSLECLSAYADPRLRVLRNECNKGVSMTANRGFDEARGAYLARIDADDLMVPDRLARQVDFMETHREIGVSGGFMRYMANVDTLQRYKTEHADIAAELLFCCALMQSSAIFRMSFIKKHGIRYDESLSAAEDYEMWFRMVFDHGAILGNLPHTLLRYRVHQGSTSFSERTPMWQADAQVRKKYLERLGIPFDDSELALQDALYHEMLPDDEPAFQSMLAWFEKLLAANQKASLFDQSALARALSSRLLRKSSGLLHLGEHICDALFSFSGFGSLPFSEAERQKYRTKARNLHRNSTDAENRHPYTAWDGASPLRVLFPVDTPHAWTVLDSVWRAMVNDSRFIPLVVPSAQDTAQSIEWLERHDVPFTLPERYSVKEHQPHIVFCAGLDGTDRRQELRFSALEAAGARCVYLPQEYDSGLRAANLKHDSFHPAQQHAWRYYFPAPDAKARFLLHVPQAKKNAYITGSPLLDYTLHGISLLPRHLAETCAEKKIVLWVIHSEDGFGKNTDAADWARLCPEICAYFAGKEKEAILILKPPTENFKGRYALPTRTAPPEKGLRFLAKRYPGTVVIDETLPLAAWAAHSHAAIMDAGPFCLQYACLDKPFCIIGQGDSASGPLSAEVLPQAGYFAKGMPQIRAFFNMVQKGKDPLLPERKKVYGKIIGPTDGLNGRRVANMVAEHMQADIRICNRIDL